MEMEMSSGAPAFSFDLSTISAPATLNVPSAANTNTSDLCKAYPPNSLIIHSRRNPNLQYSPPCTHPRGEFVEILCDNCRCEWSLCEKCIPEEESRSCPKCHHYYDWERIEERKNKKWNDKRETYLVFVLAGVYAAIITAFIVTIAITTIIGGEIDIAKSEFESEIKVLKLKIEKIEKIESNSILSSPKPPGPPEPVPLVFDGQCNSEIPNLKMLCLAFLDSYRAPLYALISRENENRVLLAAEKWSLGQRMHQSTLQEHTVLEWCVNTQCNHAIAIFARPLKEKNDQ